MTDTSSWPTITAESAKLFIPPEYGARIAGDIQCTLRYDPKLQAIHVVLANSDSDSIVEEEEKILDSFYAYDIIGADVEIKLLGSAADTPPRSTTGPASPRIFTNKSPPTTSSPAEKETGDGGCGIFKPLTEDMEKIFSACNNEPLSDLPFDTQATAVLSIYVYPRLDPSQQSPFQTWCGMGNNAARKPNRQLQSTTTEKPLGHRYAHHRRFEVAPSEDFSNLSELVRAIRTVSRPTTTTPKTGTSQQVVVLEPQQQRMLVVINPVSGPKKNGLSVYETIVSPMLQQAGISHDVLLTTHPNHAGERAARVVTTTSPTKGETKKRGTTDGEDDETVVDPVINDISAYTAIVTIGGDGVVHEVLQGIRARPDADQILRKLQFGIIPAGSANGMAASLAGWSKEMCSPLDAAFLIAKGKTCVIDLSRYETSNKKYLSFLTFSWGIVADVDIESEVIRWMGNTRFDIWGVVCVAKLRRYRAKLSYLPVVAATTNTATSTILPQPIKMPALTEPVPSDWTTVEDDFILFWTTHVSHAGQTLHIAPSVRPQDGFFTIMVVRGNVSRFRMALVLLGLETGAYLAQDCVEVIRCLAYRLEPVSPGSINDLDGEVIEEGPIQGYVLPSAIRTFCNIDAK